MTKPTRTPGTRVMTMFFGLLAVLATAHIVASVAYCLAAKSSP